MSIQVHARPRAVIFDLDGLILDIEPIFFEAWQAAGRECGLTISRELWLQTVGTTMTDCQAIFKRALGPDIPVERLSELWKDKVREIIVNKGINLLPGFHELIENLRKRGMAIGLATSSSAEMADLKLRRCDLESLFDAVVTGQDVARGKPAPEIFLEAARRLQVPPQGCLVLEDAESGIRGARAAGMRSILIPGVQPPSAGVRSLADAVLPSLNEVLQFIDREKPESGRT